MVSATAIALALISAPAALAPREPKEPANDPDYKIVDLRADVLKRKWGTEKKPAAEAKPPAAESSPKPP